MGPIAAILPCGQRLHLQHGPIDLIIGADGDRQAAFAAAAHAFETVLVELSAELPALRMPLTHHIAPPKYAVARRMDQATRPFSNQVFVTRMAAVAGSVADMILDAMKTTDICRGYVNNGGDIAVHLATGQSFTLAMAGHDGRGLGRVTITHEDPIRGIATSGRHGRSHSFGIADSVTVLAKSAACADVAATLIANAVDVPDHPAITRRAACDLDDNSDLGARRVVTGLGFLTDTETAQALRYGGARAASYYQQGLIAGAALFLNGQSKNTCAAHIFSPQRTLQHA